MKVILLGTGTPYPTVERLGSAILVAVNGRRLLFDCGRGTVVRLSQAEISPERISALFLTHLHSDHTVGIPDLWLTGWFLGRDSPLAVWGPPGTKDMMEHLSAAYEFELRVRHAPPEGLPLAGAAIDVHEVGQGVVYAAGDLRVTAFLVDHGAVKPAYGYRVDYAGRSVVISGDTRLSERLIDAAKGVDCLIHVAWKAAGKNATPEAQRSLASAEDAGRVFAMVKPGLGVVVHYADEEGLADAVRSHYRGPFVIGEDLMTIDVGAVTTWRPPPSGRRKDPGHHV